MNELTYQKGSLDTRISREKHALLVLPPGEFTDCCLDGVKGGREMFACNLDGLGAVEEAGVSAAVWPVAELRREGGGIFSSLPVEGFADVGPEAGDAGVVVMDGRVRLAGEIDALASGGRLSLGRASLVSMKVSKIHVGKQAGKTRG
jgi:hypothetical protein